MANLNVREAGMAALAGSLPVLASRYGGQIPVVGPYLQQYAVPAMGALAVGAHILANSSQASRYGTQGLAYGGAAILGNWASNYILTNVLKAPAYAQARARLSSDADFMGQMPAAGVRAESPAAQTLRVDM